MAVRDILKMGDPRLLRVAKAVKKFDTDALHALVLDMEQTMLAAHGVASRHRKLARIFRW